MHPIYRSLQHSRVGGHLRILPTIDSTQFSSLPKYWPCCELHQAGQQVYQDSSTFLRAVLLIVGTETNEPQKLCSLTNFKQKF